MANLIDELAEVLLKENAEYEELIGLSTEKTSIIVKNDIEGLNNMVAKEQTVVDRINLLEKQRESVVSDICKVLKVEPADLTVKILIDLLKKQPTEQAKLQNAHSKLVITLDKMVKVNERNKMLMNEAVEMIEFEMNLLKGMRMAPETNNYNKSAYNATMLDSARIEFDAKQ